METLIESIDKYSVDITEFIKDMNSELLGIEIGRNQLAGVESIIMYYEDEIIYNINKYEIHCRALRDKLENG